MRKLFSIILAGMLLISSLGISVSTHYCRGIVAKVIIGVGNTEASCGMENNKKECSGSESISSNCCSNKSFQIKIDDNYISYFLSKTSSADAVIVHPPVSYAVHPAQFIAPKNFNFSNAPPGISAVSLSFIRIYRI